MTTNIKTTVFWYMTPCRLEDRYQACSVLGYETVWSGTCLLAFQRNLKPPASSTSPIFITFLFSFFVFHLFAKQSFGAQWHPIDLFQHTSTISILYYVRPSILNSYNIWIKLPRCLKSVIQKRKDKSINNNYLLVRLRIIYLAIIRPS